MQDMCQEKPEQARPGRGHSLCGKELCVATVRHSFLSLPPPHLFYSLLFPLPCPLALSSCCFAHFNLCQIVAKMQNALFARRLWQWQWQPFFALLCLFFCIYQLFIVVIVVVIAAVVAAVVLIAVVPCLVNTVLCFCFAGAFVAFIASHKKNTGRPRLILILIHILVLFPAVLLTLLPSLSLSHSRSAALVKQ